MSPDEVVSLNLRRARELRGWTQPEAAKAVSRYLGKEWSTQVYGDAERAYRLKRVKVFSAEEIVAFCRAFRLPLAWFYLPPNPWTVIGPRGAGGTDDAMMTGDDLLSLIFPRADDPMAADFETATDRLFNVFAAQRPLRENLAAFMEWTRRRAAASQAMFVSQVKALGLENVPGQLEDLAGQIRLALGLVANDLRHDGIPPADGE